MKRKKSSIFIPNMLLLKAYYNDIVCSVIDHNYSNLASDNMYRSIGRRIINIRFLIEHAMNDKNKKNE